MNHEHEHEPPRTTGRVQPRCRRPRRDGLPCQTPTAVPGIACASHRGAQPISTDTQEGVA
jgi:hypothetical protein